MFAKLFDPGSRFWTIVGTVPLLIALSFLWIVCSLPIVTVIPASVALYDAVHKYVIPGHQGCFTHFFATLKKEFRGTWKLSLLWVGLFALQFLMQFGLSGTHWEYANFAVFLCRTNMVLIVLYLCWLVPLQSRFELSFGALHKNALILFVACLPYTLACFAILALLTAGCLLFLPLSLVVPALIPLMDHFFVEKAFQKYFPQ